MQKVIRTYPEDYPLPAKPLSEALSEGYEVVMCHPFALRDGRNGLEYIVEKKEKTEKFGTFPFHK